MTKSQVPELKNLAVQRRRQVDTLLLNYRISSAGREHLLSPALQITLGAHELFLSLQQSGEMDGISMYRVRNWRQAELLA